MISNQSPGGSKYPYFYKGGAIYCLHLGGYAKDEDRVIAMLQAEEKFMIAQCRSIDVWIDFYETKRTARVIQGFIQFLVNVHHLIPKLALVGCSPLDRWRINRRVKNAGCLSTLPIKYFADPEDAKTWLVSEYK